MTNYCRSILLCTEGNKKNSGAPSWKSPLVEGDVMILVNRPISP